MLILRPVVHQQQQARCPQAVDQSIEQRLGLAVDPVEILDDPEQRLLSGFPQQQPLHTIERALAPLGGGKRLPCGTLL